MMINYYISKLFYKITRNYLLKKRYYNNAVELDNISFHDIRQQILSYVESLRVDGYSYCFSKSVTTPTLYASCYACMIRGLLGDMPVDKLGWKLYFDSYQINNGLFFDDNIVNKKGYKDGEGWGAKHLVPHLCIAYERLGSVPAKKFSYLEELGEKKDMLKWLNKLNMNQIYLTSNAIMNTICTMQYARDKMGMNFSDSIITAQEWLYDRFNLKYGLWTPQVVRNLYDLENAIRGSYHIFPIFVYDKIDLPSKNETLSNIIKTQNYLGGYDSNLCSSACYDIDAIDPFVRFCDTLDHNYKLSLKKGIKWVMTNYNSDGSFVFQRYASFSYGNEPTLYSKINEGNLFATWFRLLSLMYMLNKLGYYKFDFVNVPGYEIGV